MGLSGVVFESRDRETQVRVTQGHQNRQISIRHLLTFQSIHGPISYRFLDKRRFRSKIAKFFHPRVFCAHAEGDPLELDSRTGD